MQTYYIYLRALNVLDRESFWINHKDADSLAIDENFIGKYGNIVRPGKPLVMQSFVPRRVIWFG